ncbi:MAG: cell division protein FtsX [Bacillota bacterium]|nr:ABC transporter permease [Candidatus Fermentithermobacillaceae bacterium]
MRYTLGGYLISETHKSIWRSRMSSFLSCGTTALALFLLGVAILINLNLSHLFTDVQSQMEIQAYLTMEASEEDAEAAIQVAQALNGVAEVRYVSREEAFRELQEMFQEKATVLEGIENPLPASIRLTTFRPEDVPDVVARLREIPCVDDVIYQEEASRNLAVLGRVSQVLSLGGTVIVGLVAITVIGNSTRMTIEARRHEIGIMKLVGATDGFVVGPFVLTGIVLGMFGGLLGAGLSVGLYNYLTGSLESVLPFIPILSLTRGTAINIAGILVITGVAVGTLGSALSLRRHLNV